MSGYVGYVKDCGTDLTLAKVYADTREKVEWEIEHYAWQYAQEGPVKTIVRKCPVRKPAQR